MIDTIKTTLGCVDCGYNAHPAALDFDHLPGETKTKSVSDMIGAGATISAIEDEMDKCDVVCANCHRIRTFNRSRGIVFTMKQDTA